MSIGSKIKSIRKKRGITQSELADGIITRGMLSRIESESAMPSMQSLYAIADRLEVSPSFLLEDGSDILPAELARIAKAIEDEYREKHFKNCLEIFELWQIEKDTRFAPFFASCAFEVALEDFSLGNFASCKKLLDRIETVLPNILITLPLVNSDRISFLKAVIENIDSIDIAVSYAYDIPDFDFAPSLFFSLLKLLKNGRHDECVTLLKFCNLDENYKRFLNAQKLIKDYKFIDAILEMKNLYAGEDCPVFLKLQCLASMENCCKLCEDYKGAYENHLAYQTLLNSIIR